MNPESEANWWDDIGPLPEPDRRPLREIFPTTQTSNGRRRRIRVCHRCGRKSSHYNPYEGGYRCLYMSCPGFREIAT